MEQTTIDQLTLILQAQAQQLAQMQDTIEQLTAKQTAQNPPSTTASQPLPTPSPMKMPTLEKWNGNRNTYRPFMNQIELLFELHPTNFVSETMKVAYVISNLKDNALKCVNPILENLEANSQLYYIS